MRMPMVVNGFEVGRALVKSMLMDAVYRANVGDAGDWTLQGFGMLRCHLPDDWRLNVWDSAYRAKDVSLVHDHPWHFESLVLSGALRNTRYAVEETSPPKATHLWSRLKPGPGGGLLGRVGSGRQVEEGGFVCLVAQPAEVYRAGQTYEQRRDEVHLSDPSDGCVTLNRRFERQAEDVARVFWPVGTSWVSAEPRKATAREVRDCLGRALEGWDR